MNNELVWLVAPLTELGYRSGNQETDFAHGVCVTSRSPPGTLLEAVTDTGLGFRMINAVSVLATLSANTKRTPSTLCFAQRTQREARQVGTCCLGVSMVTGQRDAVSTLGCIIPCGCQRYSHSVL